MFSLGEIVTGEKRMNPKRHELPRIWIRPIPHNQQMTLFASPVEEALANLKISTDEVHRWQKQGWISFEIDSATSLDEDGKWELEFVRNIARSGLSDQQISAFLKELPKPFSYDPLRTAYSFAYGWVQVPQMREPSEIIEEHLYSWIDEQVEEGHLEELQKLAEVLAEHLKTED